MKSFPQQNLLHEKEFSVGLKLERVYDGPVILVTDQLQVLLFCHAICHLRSDCLVSLIQVVNMQVPVYSVLKCLLFIAKVTVAVLRTGLVLDGHLFNDHVFTWYLSWFKLDLIYLNSRQPLCIMRDVECLVLKVQVVDLTTVLTSFQVKQVKFLAIFVTSIWVLPDEGNIPVVCLGDFY